jgi:hypothetical protein
MKNRSRIIVFLVIIGILIFGAVEGVFNPKISARQKQYAVEQSNPLTHNLKSILKFKNKYMGNASNLSNLFRVLPLNELNRTFELFPDSLTVDINYKENPVNVEDNKLKAALLYNATAAFALIDNLEGIYFKFPSATYVVKRSDFEKWYGVELSALLEKELWKSKVQDKLEDSKYLNTAAEALID